jgi:CheY-like chemotaxis protein
MTAVLTGCSVVLVEDDAVFGRALMQRLRLAGVTTHWAQTAAEGAALLRRHRPTLVLCDIRLPDGDGEALIARLMPELGGVPVVAMTAYGGLDQAVRLLRAGADDYLAKPFPVARIFEKLAAFARRGAPAGAEEAAGGRGGGCAGLAFARAACPAPGARARRPGCRAGDVHGGKRRRQGGRGAPAPCAFGRARRGAADRGGLRGAAHRRLGCGGPAVRAGRHAGPAGGCRGGHAGARRRWRNCPRCCRRACSACWRSAASAASAEAKPWSCARVRSRRRMPTSVPASRKAPSARTCCSGFPS